MSTFLETQSSERQRRRLQVLVSRIAVRTLSEWNKPFRRAPLERVMPHLAIANPYMSNGCRVQAAMNFYDLEKTGGDGCTPETKRRLQEAIQKDINAVDWLSFAPALYTLRGSGVDVSSYEIQALNELKRYVDKHDRNDQSPKINDLLYGLMKSGVDVALYESIIYETLQNDAEKGHWDAVAVLLLRLTGAGIDLAKYHEMILETLKHTMEDHREIDWQTIAYFDLWSSAISDMDSLLLKAYQNLTLQTLKTALDFGQEKWIPRLLTALHNTSVDVVQYEVFSLSALHRSMEKEKSHTVPNFLGSLLDENGALPRYDAIVREELRHALDNGHWDKVVLILGFLSDRSSLVMEYESRPTEVLERNISEFAFHWVCDFLIALAAVGMEESLLEAHQHLALTVLEKKVKTHRNSHTLKYLLDALSAVGIERVWGENSVDYSNGLTLKQIQIELDAECKNIARSPVTLTKMDQFRALLPGISDAEIAALLDTKGRRGQEQ